MDINVDIELDVFGTTFYKVLNSLFIVLLGIEQTDRLAMIRTRQYMIEAMLDIIHFKSHEYANEMTGTAKAASFVLQNPIIANKDMNKKIIAIVVKNHYQELHKQFMQKTAFLEFWGNAYPLPETQKKFNLQAETIWNRACSIWKDNQVFDGFLNK
jgi:hypothetical protein